MMEYTRSQAVRFVKRGAFVLFTGCMLSASLALSPAFAQQRSAAQAVPQNTFASTAFSPHSPLIMTNEAFQNWYTAKIQQKHTHSIRLAPLQGHVQRTSYALSAGDVISVKVRGHKDFSRTDITVPADGVVSLPYIGEVELLDRYRQDLQMDITRRVQEYVIEPVVDIEIMRRRPASMYVLGAVDKPGSYLQLPTSEKLPDLAQVYSSTDFSLASALANAGGVSADADLKNVHVYNEKTGTHHVANLFDLLVLGKTSQDITLRPNDVVYVPRMDKPMDPHSLKLIAKSKLGQNAFSVRVHGLVNKPNIYKLKVDQMTLQGALASAGGLLPNAKVSRVIVARTMPDGHLAKIETNAFEQDMMLRPNDIVLVANQKTAVKFNNVIGLMVRALSPPLQGSFIFRNAIQSLSTAGIVKSSSSVARRNAGINP